MLYRIAIFIAALAVVPGTWCGAAPATSRNSPPNESSGQYCGLYALYTALRIEGRPTDLGSLLRPQYVGSREGSSLEELQRAAQDFGLHAVCVKNLDSRELESCPYLAVLHVRSPEDAPEANHFVLYVGAESGSALVYDAPSPVRRVPFKQLSPVWDGTALIVAESPIELTGLRIAKFKVLAVWGLLGLCGVLTIRAVDFRLRRKQGRAAVGSKLHNCLLQFGGIFLVSGAIGSGYHLYSEDGLLTDRSAREAMQRANLMSLAPDLTERQVRQLLGSGAVFIDARFHRAFLAGHLPGAINVPISATAEQREEAMASVPKSAKLVVYCQSRSCPYAELVARRLRRDGYTQISFFRGGWREWEGQ